MAAGLGFKDFVTGEVLTAADVDGYLMQGIWVFASAAARSAAVTSPQEGNYSYLKDTNSTEYYTGSAWVAAGGAGGKVLQVVQGTYSTENSTTSTSYVSTGLSVSITPTSATSKVLVLVSQQYIALGTAPYALGTLSLFRGSTLILERKDDAHGLNVAGSGDRQVAGISDITYLDSPATTSAISYNTQMKVNQTTFRTQHSGSTSSIVCLEIGA
jgi:hypothetical protein